MGFLIGKREHLGTLSLVVADPLRCRQGSELVGDRPTANCGKRIFVGVKVLA